MNKKISFDANGIVFNDEIYNGVNFKLNHDWFVKDDLEIWTNRNKTGIQLVIDQDFIAGLYNKTLSNKTSKNVYGNITITNDSYKNIDLYISGKYISDTIEIEDTNSLNSLENILYSEYDINNSEDREIFELTNKEDLSSSKGTKPLLSDVIESKTVTKWGNRPTIGIFKKNNNLVVSPTNLEDRTMWNRQDVYITKTNYYFKNYPFYKIQAAGTNVWGRVRQSLGNNFSNYPYLSARAVFKKGDAPDSRLLIYNQTTDTKLADAKITWSTKTITMVTAGILHYAKWYGNEIVEVSIGATQLPSSGDEVFLYVGTYDEASNNTHYTYATMVQANHDNSVTLFENNSRNNLVFDKTMGTEGTVEFWVAPTFSSTSPSSPGYFLTIKNVYNNDYGYLRVGLKSDSSNTLLLDLNDASQNAISQTTTLTSTWEPYTWHHIKLTWRKLGTNDAEIKLTADNTDTITVNQNVTFNFGRIFVGTDWFYYYYWGYDYGTDTQANCYFTDLSVSNVYDDSTSHYLSNKPYTYKPANKNIQLFDNFNKIIANSIEFANLNSKNSFILNNVIFSGLTSYASLSYGKFKPIENHSIYIPPKFLLDNEVIIEPNKTKTNNWGSFSFSPKLHNIVSDPEDLSASSWSWYNGTNCEVKLTDSKFKSHKFTLIDTSNASIDGDDRRQNKTFSGTGRRFVYLVVKKGNAPYATTTDFRIYKTGVGGYTFNIQVDWQHKDVKQIDGTLVRQNWYTDKVVEIYGLTDSIDDGATQTIIAEPVAASYGSAYFTTIFVSAEPAEVEFDEQMFEYPNAYEDNYIKYPLMDLLSNFTLMVWVKFSYTPNNNQTNLPVIASTYDSGGGWLLGVEYNSNEPRLLVKFKAGGTDYFAAGWNIHNFDHEKWYLITAVFESKQYNGSDRLTASLIVNDGQVASSSNTADGVTEVDEPSEKTLIIGNSKENYNHPLCGYISGLTIIDRPLNTDEIAEYYYNNNLYNNSVYKINDFAEINKNGVAFFNNLITR